MQAQISQAVDTQLKNEDQGTPEDAEKRRSMVADVQDFQRRLFALMTAHVLANHEAGVCGHVR